MSESKFDVMDSHPSYGVDEQMYSDLPWLFWESLFDSIFFGYTQRRSRIRVAAWKIRLALWR